jgi:hypothetical protein
MVSIPVSLIKAADAAIAAAKRKYPTLTRAGFDAVGDEAPEPLNAEAVALAIAYITHGPIGRAKDPYGSAAGRLAFFARRWTCALGFPAAMHIRVGDFIAAVAACGVKIERPWRNDSGLALRLLDADRNLVDVAFVKLLAAEQGAPP